MGKLHSSLIFRSIVNGGRNPSKFHSSYSFNTIASHVREKQKKHDSLDNVDDAFFLFNKMIHKYPMPSVVEFNKLLGAIVRMKRYGIVVSMCSQMELVGVSHDVYTLSILINCFCQLGQIDFGFSILGKMLKLGVEPTVVTFSTLINGLVIKIRFLKL
ncbi:hypothetical protein J1N35_009636 [Gossypium stocksii]|uniref:Pentacotripeptide-repeat region of PRORP domain-containing protein n=1 Tax=Gossypium stocksii TaxID=47602 RepID=A0A9D4ABK2_9ROSI|nr:hypothetical protein J1N35_009636 [Gossypium stocksii]